MGENNFVYVEENGGGSVSSGNSKDSSRSSSAATSSGNSGSVQSSNTNSKKGRAFGTTETGNRRSCLFASLIVLIGFLGSGGFLYMGYTFHRNEADALFQREAIELVNQIEEAWHEYEVAALWIHESCRGHDMTREKFRALYEHLISVELDFQAAEFVPRVSHDQRQAFEDEARLYYETNYPEFPEYRGIVGLEPTPDNPSDRSLHVRPDQPFYFPVHFLEPTEGNVPARGFDLYSSPSRRAAIEEALSTWQPTLTRRIHLVQDTDESAYDVLLIHPGIPLESDSHNAKPEEVSALAIRIPSLLELAIRYQTSQLTIHLFDSTLEDDETPSDFLGAGNVFLANENEKVVAKIEYLPEVALDQVRDEISRLFLDTTLQIGTSSWTIIIQPLDETEFLNTPTFVLLGSAMLLVASLVLAIWLNNNARHRAYKMKQVLEKAEAERFLFSSLFPSNVRDRLIEEAAGVMEPHGKSHNVSAKGGGGPASSMSKAGVDDEVTKQDGYSVYKTAPIADLFPDTTIM